MTIERLRFMEAGAMGSDCTAPYHVLFNKPMTVRELISEVLKRKEWGYIGINNPSNFSIFGTPNCEYNHDKLLNELPPEYMDKTIKSIGASGGWTRMDYLLTLD